MDALIDTGATNSAVDEKVRVDFRLPDQELKRVLYPGMTTPEFRQAYVASLIFCSHFRDDSTHHDWLDLVSVLSFDLTGRAFQAVIGMDTSVWSLARSMRSWLNCKARP